eukprot:7290645-Heterocapsa_arctica.AAC.1
MLRCSSGSSPLPLESKISIVPWASGGKAPSASMSPYSSVSAGNASRGSALSSSRAQWSSPQALPFWRLTAALTSSTRNGSSSASSSEERSSGCTCCTASRRWLGPGAALQACHTPAQAPSATPATVCGSKQGRLAVRPLWPPSGPLPAQRHRLALRHYSAP